MKSRSKKPKAASAANAPAHDQGESVAGIIMDIEGEAQGDGVEMMGEDAGAGNPPDAVPSRIPVPITAVIEQAEPIRIPSPESNPNRSKTAGNAGLKRESNLEGPQSTSGGGQFPLTRSRKSQRPENQRKTVQNRVTSRECDTKVGHNVSSNSASTPSKQTEYSPLPGVTKVGHKRWPRGLSLRGSIYQFRVRVPADLLVRTQYS